MTSWTPDKVSIVGLGNVPYSRNAGGKSLGALTLDACMSAIRDAGIDKADIDGVAGTAVRPSWVQNALGLGDLAWATEGFTAVAQPLLAAIHAIRSGACTTVLVYHSGVRNPGTSSSAARDPFRLRGPRGFSGTAAANGTGHVDIQPHGLFPTACYAAWATRYFHEYGAERRQLGYIALNARACAREHRSAVYDEPLTMDDYLSARMVREPLSILDMDIAVDFADAFILTTTERGREISDRSVLVHAASAGYAVGAGMEQTWGFDNMAPNVVAGQLRKQSSLSLNDITAVFAYDGFSTMSVPWFEAIGFCGRGEALSYLEESWDESSNRLLLAGRVPVNPHGGQLGGGASHGAGHIRGAVEHLRTRAADSSAQHGAAYVTFGGQFEYAFGFVLRI